MSTAGERSTQSQILAALYREIDAAYEEFELAVAGKPTHGRIDDVRNAFNRLRHTLSAWRSSHPTS